MSFFK
jgi:hypothetical protein